ncbi:MAG: A24 family peptidase [Bacillota bacterium]
MAILISVSLYNDLLYRKIPNKITVSAAVTGLAVNLVANSITGLFDSILAILLGFVLMLIPFLIGGIGGGDVKLIIAIGAISGMRFTFYTIIFTAMAGAAIALFIIICQKTFLKSITNVWKYLISTILLRDLVPIDVDEKQSSFPYGLAIAAGVVITLIYKNIKLI